MRLTASGVVGWGEVLPAAGNTREPYIAMIQRFAEGIIGEDETEIKESLENDAKDQFHRRLRHHHGRNFRN